MMMTNITFTKGIGTPVYMAPEILKHQHYKMPADIFSFAITMFETFAWNECYSKREFKFPWKIAEFVVNGKRQRKHDEIDDEEFDLIEKSWNENPKERLEMNEIVKRLEILVLNENDFSKNDEKENISNSNSSLSESNESE